MYPNRFRIFDDDKQFYRKIWYITKGYESTSYLILESILHYQSIMLDILMTKILKSKMGYFIDVGQCGKYIHYGTFSYHKYKLLKICPYN